MISKMILKCFHHLPKLRFMFLSVYKNPPRSSQQGEALKTRCGGVVLVEVDSATFLSCQIGAPNTHTDTHVLRGSYFPTPPQAKL